MNVKVTKEMVIVFLNNIFVVVYKNPPSKHVIMRQNYSGVNSCSKVSNVLHTKLISGVSLH